MLEFVGDGMLVVYVECLNVELWDVICFYIVFLCCVLGYVDV